MDTIPKDNCNVATDQRGYSRPIDVDNNGSINCDIGAYEADFEGIFKSSFEEN